MKRTLALFGILLLAASLVSPIISAESSQTSITLNTNIEPEYFNTSFRIIIPVNSSILEDLDANANLTLTGGSLTGKLYARGYSPQLENITGTAALSGNIETTYIPGEGKVLSNSSQSAAADLTLYGNNTRLAITANITTTARSVFSTVLNSGSTNRTYALNMSINNPDRAGIAVILSGREESTTTEAYTSGSGTASGHISMTGAPQQISVDLNAVYSYSLDLASRNITINATIDIVASDYMTASQIYLALIQAVQLLNLSSYVKIEPPSLMNPTVRVIVNYSGHLNLTAVPSLGPGVGGLAGLLPKNTTLLLPANISMSPTNITASFNASSTVTNGSFTVSSSLESSASPAPGLVNATLGLSAYYDNNLSAVVIDGSLELESPCAHYNGFLLLKELAAAAFKYDNVSLQGSITGYGGVRFLVGGQEASTVELGNTLNTSSLAIIYGDLVYYSPNRTAIAIGENVSLPLMVRGVVLNNTNLVRASLPFDKVIVLGNLNLEAPGVANVTVKNGSTITGDLVFGFESPENVSIPLPNATVIGYAVAVRNVSGMLDLRIKLTTNISTGVPVLLVIHDNGTTSIIYDIAVKQGYLVAEVPASSTYIPLILGTSGGGGGGTNTTTTTSPGKTVSTTTSTQPPGTATSTTTPPSTTTITTVYTSTTVYSTGTTGARTSSTSPGSTSTPPAGYASSSSTASHTTTTGTSQSNAPGTSGSQTGGGSETPAGQGGKTGLVAAGIIAIVIIIAALLVARR